MLKNHKVREFQNKKWKKKNWRNFFKNYDQALYGRPKDDDKRT